MSRRTALDLLLAAITIAVIAVLHAAGEIPAADLLFKNWSAEFVTLLVGLGAFSVGYLFVNCARPFPWSKREDER